MSKESAYFIVKPVDPNRDKAELKSKLGRLHGILSVSVDTENDLVAVDYDSAGMSYDKIENSLNKMGYEIAADASNIQTR